MNIKGFFLILFFSSLSFHSDASAYFEMTPLIEEAYDKVINLRFREAEVLLEQIKEAESDNLLVYHIENYIDFFKVFIGENKEEFKRLEKNKTKRLNEIKKGDKNSPYYYYTQAEIKLQWALARLKFEEYFNAFNEVSAAYDLLEKNQRHHPNFIANKKSLGMIHALVGTLPDNYKWGIKLLGGMDGDISKGIAEIEEVLEYAQTNNFIFEEETTVMYAFLLLHLNNKSEEAWSTLQNSRLDTKQNPLACFVMANVAMRTGRNDDAIEILKFRPQGRSFYSFHFLDYMLGMAKLNRLDDDADIYIQKYLSKFNGINYIKEAHQKLAWFNLLQNNITGYHQQMTLCKKEGKSIIDGDKTALKEANEGQVPDITLLKSRLLFDGGYYQRAYDLLQEKSIHNFSNKKSKLEYTYRLGRITHQLKNNQEAIDYYQSTIDNGQYESYFFACNAALQIATIHELSGKLIKAKEYYNLCLKIKPDEYRNGLHAKAKAGLNRLED